MEQPQFESKLANEIYKGAETVAIKVYSCFGILNKVISVFDNLDG